MADKLIFPIGFDLEEGVKEASKEWKSTYQKQLQKAIDDKPLKAKIELETKGLDLGKLKEFNKISKEMVAASKANAKIQRDNIAVQERQRLADERTAAAHERTLAAVARRRKAEEGLNHTYRAQSNYLSRLVQRMIAYASIAQAFSFVRNIREVTAEFELQRVALGSIIGDLNKANAMFEQIKAAAVKSPFQIKELVTYTKQLAAYKIETDELFETTQRLADVSAGLGVGMERLVLAYGQIRATGYLRASEVRQLTEAGIPIVEELAKKMSQLRGETVSAAEVMGMISERAISFGMVKEVFDDMTSAGGMFYKMQEKQAETLAGQWSNLQDSIAIMYEEIGNTSGVKSAMSMLISTTKALAENWNTVANIGLWAAIGVGVKSAIKNISLLTAKKRIELNITRTQAIYEKEFARLRTLRASGDIKAINATIAHLRKLRKEQQQLMQESSSVKPFGFLSSIKNFFVSNIWAIGITAIGSFVTWLFTAESAAKKVESAVRGVVDETNKIISDKVSNFEGLAYAAVNAADGSREQMEALQALQSQYQDIIPIERLQIDILREMKGEYGALTQAIAEKQLQEGINNLRTQFDRLYNLTPQKEGIEEQLQRWWSPYEIGRFFAELDKRIKNGQIVSLKSLTDIESIIKEAGIRPINTKDLSDALLGHRIDSDWYEQYYSFNGLTSFGKNLYKYIQRSYTKNAQLRDGIDKLKGEIYGTYNLSGNILEAIQNGEKDLNDKIEDIERQFALDVIDRTEADEKIARARLDHLMEIVSMSTDENAKLAKESIQGAYDQLLGAISNGNAQLDTDLNALQSLASEFETSIASFILDWVKDVRKHTGWKSYFDGLFEDSEIDQFGSLDDALSKAANKYNDLAQKIKTNKNTLKEGTIIDTARKKIQSDTKDYEALSEKIYATLDALGALHLLRKQNGGGEDSELSQLKEEIRLLEKIYAKYKEYRQYMSAEEAKAKTENYFSGTIASLRFGAAFDDDTMQNILRQYQDEARKLPKSETEILEIDFKIGDIDWDKRKREMDDKLKKLSDEISRTKTAKEFFERMLGMTGDKELSATLTMNVYGEGGDLGKKLAEQTIEEAELAFAGLDISKAIDKNTGSINYALLRTMLPALEDISEKQAETAEKFVSNGEKANADWLIDLQKTYQKAFTFEQRRTQVMEQEAKMRKKIEESASLSPEEKAEYTEASRKTEAERISAINLEEFKESSDYLKIFKDLDELATPTIERLIDRLREFIATNKELNATDLKNLTEQIDKLEEGLISRNPYDNLIKSVERLRVARQKLSATSFKDEAEYTDALDEQENAYADIEKALSEMRNEYGKAEQTIRDFADALGIADDSDAGVFLNGIADAFGTVQKAIIFADIAMKLFDGTIKAFLASNPIGWIALIAGGLVGLFRSIANAKVRRANREIERQQQLLDQLAYSYERLGKAQEKAFGMDYISNYEQRLANLQAQQKAYLKQANAERSKGKKADSDKIKEYEEQARETADAIKDMQSEVAEHILGTDLTSAARDFASAWIDAYKEFGSTTDAMKEKFQDMIQNMIVESFAAKVIQTALEPIFDSIDAMSKDGILEMSEASKIAEMTNLAVGNIDVGMTNLMNALSQAGISVRGMGSDLTGISRDIATASEESILGLAAGINTQNFYISQVPTKLDTIIGLLRGENLTQGSAITLQDLVTIQNQHLSHLPSIAQHTADTVAECKQIVAETRRTADALERVIKPRGTQATHVVNTTL